MHIAKMLEKLQCHIRNEKKLRTYLKPLLNLRHRLMLFLILKQEVILVKFRLSSHNLLIETGRYGKILAPKENRICAFCKYNSQNHVHDKLDFLMIKYE